MRLIEFSTVSENGILRIPEEYRGAVKGPVRVVIMLETGAEATQGKAKFEAVRIKTARFKFSREEANER